MENTLKVTNVLSDPTRYKIYQRFLNEREPVTVLNIAEAFDIHPNVARLHLSKLEEINLITSSFLKTGKGGRPSRIYTLSDHVIELSFPSRDYKLLSSIALQTLAGLDNGEEALYETGRKYGLHAMDHLEITKNDIDIREKIDMLEDAGMMLGMYAKFDYDEESHKVSFRIQNCPFYEIAETNPQMVCTMHHSFLKGMFEALFDDVELTAMNNMFDGCENCSYIAKIASV